MPYSISLWFDPNTEESIRAIWALLAERDISAKFDEGPYRPHVTLAVCKDLIVDDCAVALDAYAGSKASFLISFESLGVFAGATSVLFLAPRPTFRLLQTQQDVSRILGELGSSITHAYYAPGQWTPHCSLAVDLTPNQLSQALDLGVNLKVPIEGVVNRIGIIQNPEEIELYETHYCGHRIGLEDDARDISEA